MPITDGSIVNDHEDIETPPALPVGFVVGGKYKIKRVLGSGGNGAVYEGEHTEVGHRVAIKVAHHKQDDRGDVMLRFRREARISGSLRHPHVGQVFDVGTLDEGAPYMVMELQEGRSLADVLDETSLPIAAIIDITRQLLAGLSAAHQAGAVHLDVKPDNVMLTRDHGGDVVVKLVDFGISKRLDDPEPEPTADDERIIVGSPDYMPPEQLQGERVDARTDLYAAGVLLYEAITGRPPFDGATTADLVLAVMSDPVPALTTLRPDCPAELERLVLKALSRKPDDRFQSADEMSRALAALRTNVRNAPPTNLAKLSERPPRPRSTSAVVRRRTIDARTLQTVRLRARPVAQARTQPIPKQALAAGGVALVCLFAIVAVLRTPGSDTQITVSAVPQLPVAPAQAEPSRAAAEPAPGAAASSPTPVAQPTVAAPSAAASQAEVADPDPAPERDAPASASASTRSSGSRARPSRAPAASSAARVREPARAPAPVVVVPPPPPPKPDQDPQLTRTQLKAAAAAFNHGQVAQALGMYRQLVKVAPNTPDAWRGLAVTANKMAERAEAERALRRYLKLRPSAGDPNRILQSLR